MPTPTRFVMLAVIAALAVPATAAQPQYLDDRSTPEAVIASFYNAIGRQEYARAWSYYADGQGVPAFDAFDADGLAPFLPRYALLDALAGRAVRVHAASGVRDGVAAGLADDGSLQVRDADGNVFAVHAGDVSVRAA